MLVCETTTSTTLLIIVRLRSREVALYILVCTFKVSFHSGIVKNLPGNLRFRGMECTPWHRVSVPIRFQGRVLWSAAVAFCAGLSEPPVRTWRRSSNHQYFPFNCDRSCQAQ